MIETLIRSGANVNAVDKVSYVMQWLFKVMSVQNGSSSLHFAVENNQVDIVDLLLKSKADINASNKVYKYVHR